VRCGERVRGEGERGVAPSFESRYGILTTKIFLDIFSFCGNDISSDTSHDMVFAGRTLCQGLRRTTLNVHADIPGLIRELRKQTGLTQEKFAAKLGVTFPTINRWENGRSKPSPLAMQRIIKMLRNMGGKNVNL